MKTENCFCQSCGMPMGKEEEFGTEKSGMKSADYCCYCFKDGSFVKEETMEQMIESCIPFVLEAGVYESAEQARAAMLASFPNMKRWAKASRGVL